MSKEVEDRMREVLAEVWDEGYEAARLAGYLGERNPYRPTPPDPEPAKPLNCRACGVSYEICTRNLRTPRGKCCCPECHYTATHNQNAWEAWERRQKGRD